MWWDSSKPVSSSGPRPEDVGQRHRRAGSAVRTEWYESDRCTGPACYLTVRALTTFGPGTCTADVPVE
jgi:hypothetical protein